MHTHSTQYTAHIPCYRIICHPAFTTVIYLVKMRIRTRAYPDASSSDSRPTVWSGRSDGRSFGKHTQTDAEHGRAKSQFKFIVFTQCGNVAGRRDRSTNGWRTLTAAEGVFRTRRQGGKRHCCSGERGLVFVCSSQRNGMCQYAERLESLYSNTIWLAWGKFIAVCSLLRPILSEFTIRNLLDYLCVILYYSAILST